MSPEAFDEAQRRALTEALRSGERPVCPACDTPLDERPVPPRPDVAYVRDRLLLVCPSCRRAVVLERRPD